MPPKPTPIYETLTVNQLVGWHHPACARCGQPFTSKRPHARTCSDRCRNALSRDKRKP